MVFDRVYVPWESFILTMILELEHYVPFMRIVYRDLGVRAYKTYCSIETYARSSHAHMGIVYHCVIGARAFDFAGIPRAPETQR